MLERIISSTLSVVVCATITLGILIRFQNCIPLDVKKVAIKVLNLVVIILLPTSDMQTVGRNVIAEDRSNSKPIILQMSQGVYEMTYTGTN